MYTPTPDYYRDYIQHGMQHDEEDTLAHYGVKGMKWRKKRSVKKKADYQARKMMDDMEKGRAASEKQLDDVRKTLKKAKILNDNFREDEYFDPYIRANKNKQSQLKKRKKK